MSRAERVESAAQGLLTVAVGGVAGAAAWSHVVDLAVGHGQSGWLAWADAAVIETLAVSAGLEIRRRRRHGQPVRAVVAVLVAAVVLSLAAQVATAEASPWGWVMAAVPAVGFLAMAKIALGRPAARTNEGSSHGQVEDHGRDLRTGQRAEGDDHRHPAAVAGSAEDRPAGHGSPDLTQPHDQDRSRSPEDRSWSTDLEPYDDGRPLPDANARALLLAGVEVLTSLECRGVALTRTSLVEGLRRREVKVSTDRATELLRQLRGLSAADRDRLHESVSAEWEVAR